MLPVAVAWSCDGNAIHYHFCFVDDVMFSHNGANGPESHTTHMFRPVHKVAAPEAKSTISDCIFFIFIHVNMVDRPLTAIIVEII